MKKHISPSNNLKNLNLIINSDTYKLAHEDIGLLNRNEMRGVRMLLEITKPDLILEENKILSTIIIFGGATITEESNTKKRIENIEELIKDKLVLINVGISDEELALESNEPIVGEGSLFSEEKYTLGAKILFAVLNNLPKIL